MKFYVIDAFSSASFGGKPAGVIIIDEGMDFPEDSELLEMAGDTGFSETVFIKQIAGDMFHLRYFSPSCELDMCGHATIAAYTALLREGTVKNGTYINISKAGTMDIYISDDFVTLQMPVPEAESSLIDDPEIIDRIYSRMSLKYEKVITENTTSLMFEYMPPVLAASLPDITMPVMSGEVLALTIPELHMITEEIRSTEDFENLQSTHSLSPVPAIHDAAIQLPEGSELEKARRPSRLIAKTEKKGDAVNIHIGGAGVILAEGNIFA